MKSLSSAEQYVTKITYLKNQTTDLQGTIRNTIYHSKSVLFVFEDVISFQSTLVYISKYPEKVQN